MRLVALVLIGLLSATALSGCTATRGNVYSADEARSAWTVRQGRILEIRAATIEGRSTQVGRVGGGLVGYEVGRTVGSGSGSRIAGAVGAVAGAVAGSAVEKQVTRQAASEILVELDDGRTIQVVQPADQEFSEGERVRVYTRGGQARVGRG